MSKHFRPWNIDQTLLLPPNVRDFVPKDHVSRFIVGLVRESLDLKAIMCSYVSGLGQPPFDPRMMVSLLLHGYASGLYSSRRIARACCERNDFVMIVALDPPDFRTISDFRKRHLKAPRRIQPACIAMQQKRNHHARIERRLAEPTHIAAHDRLEIQALPHQPNDKPRDVVLGHEVPHIRRQKQRLIDIPGAKVLAHSPSFESNSLGFEQRLLGQAPSGRKRP